jgi:1-acyl-sn-glycerol-3-phosphate acyltransferase
MLYNIFYHLLKFTCYIYFRKIRLYQTENIPSKKPLIICANHGNSFMDAILIAIIFKRKLHFLARADAFNSPFKRWFLSQINMMPIYRIRDGREEVKNNDAIFEKCQSILDNNGAILIFPEGTCVIEKRLRTFKTGFVQLAFESKATNLQVLPITINYSKPLNYYTEVSFYFSNPIAVAPLKKDTNDYILFSKNLIKQVKEKIEKEMIIITHNNDDEFYEQILELTRNINYEKFILNQLKIVKQLNQLKEDNIILFNDLKESIKLYFENLKFNKLTDEAVSHKYSYSRNKLFIIYPFFIVGHIIHYLPVLIIQSIINLKVKEAQFTSAIRMVVGLFTYLIYMPIIFISISLVIDFGSIYLLGFLYFHYANFHHVNLMQQINVNTISMENLSKQRMGIIKLLNL